MDSEGAEAVIKRETTSSKTKHIRYSYHMISDYYASKLIDIKHVKGTENPADALTKPLAKDKFDYYLHKMQVGTVKSSSRINNVSSNTCWDDDILSFFYFYLMCLWNGIARWSVILVHDNIGLFPLVMDDRHESRHLATRAKVWRPLRLRGISLIVYNRTQDYIGLFPLVMDDKCKTLYPVSCVKGWCSFLCTYYFNKLLFHCLLNCLHIMVCHTLAYYVLYINRILLWYGW